MEYFFCAFIGYFIGSFPTGYVILKRLKKIDITNEGSGNVGAMNSYEVTNSRLAGISVFFIDFIKGIASVILTEILFGMEFNLAATSIIFAVLSHCYSPWIKFKGGRGLSTAAGGSLFLFPIIIAIWLILWTISYFISRNVHIGNSVASFLTALATIFSGNMINRYSVISPVPDIFFMISVSLIMLIILSRHISPLKEILVKQKINRK